MDSQSLVEGEPISLAFSVPTENSELLGSMIIQYCVNFLIADMIIQVSG